ncbi:MAG: hypothetical protein ACREOK_04630 [Gemmatimonadaceae bacterium]
MADMPMDMPMGDTPMDMAGHSDRQGSDSGSDCTFPSSLAGCESMASCAQNALAVDAPVIVASDTRSDDDSTWFIQQLRSVTRSPESPPPRA